MHEITLYTPITKKDDKLHMVYGYATTEALDSQGEIVSKDAIKNAMADYMKWANVRVMHQPKAIGKTKEASIDEKGMYVGIKVVDKDEWEKVEEGVYNGFSIGGRVKQMIANEITELTLSEISLVDRPANPECKFDVYKADNINMDVEKPEVKEEVKVDEPKEEVKEPVEQLADADPVVAEVVKEPETTVVATEGDSTGIVAAVIENAPDVTTEAPKEEAVVEEKVDKPEIKKSLYDVARFASILQELADLEEYIEMDGQMEGNDPMDEEFADKLAAEIKTLGELLVARAQRETEELNAEEDDEENAEPTAESQEVTMSEKSVFEKVEDILKTGTMPDEGTINEVLEKMSMDKTQSNIDALRLKFADRIMEVVDEQIKKNNTDSVKSNTSIVLEKVDELTSLLKKVEDQTSDAKAKMEVGVVTGDMIKIEAELASLKDQIAKFVNTPLPIKAKASYVAVEKFGTTSGDVSERLAKAEARGDELQKLLAKPHDSAIEKEASDLSIEIMRLRRQA